jgi:hypothetical protein
MASSGKEPRGGRQLPTRHPARQTGTTALLLLSATTVTTVVLARGYHLGVAATLTALLGGIPGLYLAWAAYRDDRIEAQAANSQRLEEIADELAVAVRAQWEAEAGMRRLNDPFLPVRWVPADDLADDWAAVVALATSGAGWPAPTSSDIWAANTANLAGEGGTIASALASIPTRRLVILGGPEPERRCS